MTKEQSPSPKQSSSSPLPVILLLIIAAVVIYMMQVRPPRFDSESAGQGFPPLEMVGGWLNTDGPLTVGDLKGKVVLVDYWATWCGPCRANMPHVAATNAKFQGQGLLTIGITPESLDDREKIATYARSVEGMTWPIGYGAQMALDMMEIRGIPTLVLYDRTGTSVWAGHSHHGLDEAIVAALAKK